MAYTWSKVTSDTGLANSDGPGMSAENAYTDSTQPELDKARGAIDRTHVFSGSLVLALPKLEDKGSFARGPSSGTGSSRASSRRRPGIPTRSSSGACPGSPGTDRWRGRVTRPTSGRTSPGEPCPSAAGSNEAQWFNPAAFTINNHLIGTNGNAGRHICDGPGFFRVDAALYKNFRLGKRVALQFRVEMFNVFNRTNFLSDDGTNVAETWTPQNVAVRHREPHHGDARHQRDPGGRLRGVWSGRGPEADADRSPTELLII